jgi:hypothetical protein
MTPTLRSSLSAQLAALDAKLAPAPLRVLPMFTAQDPPEDPTVTVSLRVAGQIELALRMAARELSAAARATHGPSSEDVAAAHMRASDMQSALDAFEPLISAAVEENRRRRAEWRRQQGRG